MSFLFVDRILELTPGQKIRGIKHVTHDDVYLYSDTRDHHYFMPSMIGETLGQLTAWAVMAHCNFTKRPVAGIASNVKLYRNVYVGETLLLESFIDSLDDDAVHYHSIARVGAETVFTIDDALGPLLPMASLIDDAVVRHQFDEVNRPGEWVDTASSGRFNLLLPDPSTRITVPMCFDHVIASEPGVSLSATKRINRAAPYFQDHFPNKPVLPMTVLIECQLGLIPQFLNRAGFGAGFAKHYRVEAINRIKMSDFVHPGDQIRCTLTVKYHHEDELILQVQVDVAGKRVAVMDVALRAEKSL